MLYYCPICGLPAVNYYHPKNYIETLNNKKINEQNINKIFKILEKCIILTSDNKILHDSYQENSSLINNNNEYSYSELNINIYKNKEGIMIHKDCWKYIKNKYNIELQYGDLPYIDNINFGEIKKYQQQYFEWIECIQDDNVWMIDTPLNNKNKKNINRINKIIKQYKFKKNINRKSPNISATFFTDDIIKIGNNNKFWIIKNGKWNQINDIVIIKHYNIVNENVKDKRKEKSIEYKNNIKKIKYINKIKQIGYYSYKPIFINNIEFKNKICSFDIYTTEDFYNLEVCKYLG